MQALQVKRGGLAVDPAPGDRLGGGAFDELEAKAQKLAAAGTKGIEAALSKDSRQFLEEFDQISAE